MFVTMRNEKWQRRSLSIPVAPGSRQYHKFTLGGGPNGDGVYEVSDELGFELCYGDGYKVKTVADPARGVVYRESMFIEGSHPTKKMKSAAQLAAELEELEKKVEFLMTQSVRAGVPPGNLEDDEYEVIQDAMYTAGLKDLDAPIDENDPSGRYQRIEHGIIHDTETGAYICPVCKLTKTTESVKNPKKAIEMHWNMKHKDEMEPG
jgi:hypothetical protein